MSKQTTGEDKMRRTEGAVSCGLTRGAVGLGHWQRCGEHGSRKYLEMSESGNRLK